MKKLNQMLAVAGVAVVLGLSSGSLRAQEGQGRGNFDPEQFRQRMMDRYKERLEVKSDDEWKIISERIEKVSKAQREARIEALAVGGAADGEADLAAAVRMPRRRPMTPRGIAAVSALNPIRTPTRWKRRWKQKLPRTTSRPSSRSCVMGRRTRKPSWPKRRTSYDRFFRCARKRTQS